MSGKVALLACQLLCPGQQNIFWQWQWVFLTQNRTEQNTLMTHELDTKERRIRTVLTRLDGDNREEESGRGSEPKNSMGAVRTQERTSLPSVLFTNEKERKAKYQTYQKRERGWIGEEWVCLIELELEERTHTQCTLRKTGEYFLRKEKGAIASTRYILPHFKNGSRTTIDSAIIPSLPSSGSHFEFW